MLDFPDNPTLDQVWRYWRWDGRAWVPSGSAPQGPPGPEGPEGPPGIPGTNGTDGTNGLDGAAATITIGSVTTGAAGTNAEVENVGTGNAAVFDFTIPRGADGGGGLNHATSDGNYYASRNGAWAAFTPGISQAPSNGNWYASYNGAWTQFTPGISHATSNNIYYTSRNGAWTADPIQSDAPSANAFYGRYNGAWQQITASGLGITLAGLGGITHAPSNNTYYSSRNGAWTADPIQADATSDSTAYGRMNAAWTRVLPLTGGTLTGALTGTQLTLSGTLNWSTTRFWTFLPSDIQQVQGGVANVTGSLSWNGNVIADGALRARGAFWIGNANNAGLFINQEGMWNQTVVHRFSANCAWLMDYTDASLGWQVLGSSVFGISAAGTLVIVGFAYKPGGGLWADGSDARIKQVERNFTRGLDTIEAITPVVYKFLGNDTDKPPEGEQAPYKNSSHGKCAEAGTEYIGLIAQDVEDAFPEMVTKQAGYIDGNKVNDLRTLDETPLVFALVNAVKELSAQVRELTARIATLEAA